MEWNSFIKQLPYVKQTRYTHNRGVIAVSLWLTTLPLGPGKKGHML